MTIERIFVSFQVSVQIRSPHFSCYVRVLNFRKTGEDISSNRNNIKRKNKVGDTCIFQENMKHSASTVGKNKA